MRNAYIFFVNTIFYEKTLKKLVKYLIGAIYFLVPVFFSHILKVLGFPVMFGTSSYERIKVELFYALFLMIIPFWLLSPFFSKSPRSLQEKENSIMKPCFLRYARSFDNPLDRYTDRLLRRHGKNTKNAIFYYNLDILHHSQDIARSVS